MYDPSDEYNFENDDELAELAAQKFQDNHPQLRDISTQINLTTPTAANIAEEAEKISAGSGSLQKAAGKSGTASKASSALQKVASTGIDSSSIMGIPADMVSNAFLNSGDNFKDGNLANNTKAGNFSTGFTDALNSFNTAMRSATSAFSTEVANLQKKGLTFLASTTSKMIDGIDLPGLSELGNFAKTGLGQLGKLASMGSNALRSVGDGLKAVVSTVGTAIECGKQALNTVVSSVVQPIAQVGSAILGPVKDVATLAYTITDPRFAASIVSSNLDFLPGPLQAIAANKAAQAVSSLTGNVHNKVANILNKANALDTILGVGMTGDVLGAINSFGNGFGGFGLFGDSSYVGGGGYSSTSGYYNLSGPNGQYVYGVSSYRGEANQYSALAGAVQVLCGNIDVEERWESWGDDKDLFDILLREAMKTGAGQLVAALLGCGKSSSYYSGRTTNIIRSNISDIAMNGDLYTYKSLVSQKGAEVVTNPKQDVLALYVNSPYSEEAKADLEVVMNSVNVTMQDVISTEEKAGGKYTVLDSGKVTVMQKADPEYQKAFLTDDEFAAVNAALALYGSTA